MILKRCATRLQIARGAAILVSADLMAVNLVHELETTQIFVDKIQKSAGEDNPADLRAPRNARNLRNSVQRTPKNVEVQASQPVVIQRQQAAFHPKAAIIRHLKKDIQQILRQAAPRPVVVG